MNIPSHRAIALAPLALLAATASASVAAQDREVDADVPATNPLATVYGSPPADLAGMPKGARITGFLSARKGERLQVTSGDGSRTVVVLSEATEVRTSGGFLGLGNSKLATNALLNGVPVTIDTVEWGNALVARRINLKARDLRTAAMIHNGTDQRFGEQAAATEALRSRMADIDKYNIKATTNVNFAVGKSALTPSAKAELCDTAAQAVAMDNALLLVIGYTDSTGSQELNQRLSEKRASSVVNHLQQACGWKPYRMLTPTGMAEADPMASNDSAYGKAQNRRVAVNIMVSKSVDGF
jgi:OOP family OmpA-OmpF porin